MSSGDVPSGSRSPRRRVTQCNFQLQPRAWTRLTCPTISVHKHQTQLLPPHCVGLRKTYYLKRSCFLKMHECVKSEWALPARPRLAFLCVPCSAAHSTHPGTGQQRESALPRAVRSDHGCALGARTCFTEHTPTRTSSSTFGLQAVAGGCPFLNPDHVLSGSCRMRALGELLCQSSLATSALRFPRRTWESPRRDPGAHLHP